MSELAESLKKLKYDKRMINWNLRQKRITKKEYEKHLTELKDISYMKDTTKEESQGEPDQL
ncbi:MAG: hypothetical protein OXJ52_02470 [Oligoflexia bacterium]|nr:hypothetical protein [Oligoflexia bacterium]